VTSKARIHHKEVVSLQFGEDEVQLNISKFKHKPYHNDVDTKENEIFPELATVHLNNSEDALERSLSYNVDIPND
jgi:hypothetical protein